MSKLRKVGIAPDTSATIYPGNATPQPQPVGKPPVVPWDGPRAPVAPALPPPEVDPQVSVGAPTVIDSVVEPASPASLVP